MDIVSELRKNPFVLAPMAGVTDNAFRSFMKEQGAHIVVTELVSSHGIKYQGEQTLKLMKFEREQSPVGVQLFGETPEIVAEAAKYVEGEGADFIDLNFGCPVKKVVKKGAGSAILKEPERLRAMVRGVKSAIGIPLTIKIRTGWDEDSRNADLVCQIAYDEGVSWVAIHGRTRAQAYAGAADWDYIGEVKSKSPLPVIGNGDIITPESAVEKIEKFGCDGVMIGRGCLKNPAIFRDAFKLWKDRQTGEKVELTKVFRALRFHLERNYDDRMTGIQLKKFASWYSAGYPQSANFRKKIFQVKEIDEIVGEAESYFESIKISDRLDQSKEKFMMGGHG